MGPAARVSDSVALEWGLVTCISNKFPVSLILLIWKASELINTFTKYGLRDFTEISRIKVPAPETSGAGQERCLRTQRASSKDTPLGTAPGQRATDGFVQQPLSSSFFKKYFIYLFLERGKGREKERKKNIDERETLIGCLLYVP